MPTVTFTSPASCTTTTGTLQLFMGGSNTATVDVIQLGQSCTASSGSTCSINEIPFGTYTLEVDADCSPLNANVTVNGQSQTGNGLLTFTVTTDIVTPDISITVNCS